MSGLQGTPLSKLRGIAISALCIVAVAALLLVLGQETRPGLQLRFALERALGGTVRTLEVPDVPPVDIFLDPDSLAITPLVMENGLWEPGETALFVASLKPGDVVVDIGANVGYFTLIASQLVGSEGRVYAFEPDPVTFRFLERNVALASAGNVVLERKAVSNENGKTKLFFDDAIREDSRIYEPHVGVLAKVLDRTLDRSSVEVEMVRLDDYFAGVEEHLDLIKIDTQGAEGVIVEGLLGIAKRSPRLVMIVEYVPALLQDFDYAPAKLLENLASLEMEMYAIHPVVAPKQIRPVRTKGLLAKSTGEMLFFVRPGDPRSPATSASAPR